MSDWRRTIDRRLARLGVAPLRRVEIIEELSAHLLDRYEEARTAGHTPAEARRLVLADLEADVLLRELAKTESRATAEPPLPGARRRTLMSTLWQDLSYAARSLRHSPGFSLVVILTLALGIGANAAIFSVADAVMLRPYPYPDLDRIIVLNERTRTGDQMSVAWPTFQDWRAQNNVFQHLALYRNATANYTGGDQAERLSAALASSELFATLGIQPTAGRVFGAADDDAGAARTAIISERLWRSRFNADPAILGRSVALNGEPHTIVGIMPPTMRFPGRATDVWMPLGPAVATFPPSRGAHPGLFAVGKLKDGVTFERARADMDTIARRLEQQFPDTNKDVAVEMTPYYEQIVRNIRPTLQVLLGAVGFVLLIACANLANLMLARAERRHQEMAVRRALGADRWRIIQQQLTESLVLALAGGALGLLLAYWAVQLFVGSQPTTIPRIDLVGIDRRVFAFAALLSLATGIAFGLLPALRASTPDLSTGLRQGGRGSVGRGFSRGLRSTLVIAQVALALMLLVGAGLMIRSLGRLLAIEPGFDPDNVVTMRLALPVAKYPGRERWVAFHEALVEKVAAIPGISAAGVNSALPLEGGGSESRVIIDGRPLPAPGERTAACLYQAISPDYYRAMGIRLVQGRFFASQDRSSSARVAIVDETFVAKFFPGEDPIGKRFAFEFQGTHEQPEMLWREIVGVVGHVRHYGLTSGPPYVQVYVPLAQPPLWFDQRRPAMAIVARSPLPTDGLSASIRREVSAIDRDIPVYGVQMMSRYLSQQIEQPRMSVLLLSGLGGLALLLAVVGIYGVISYTVAQRTQEIGVRMALGASSRQVMRIVVGHVAVLVGAGVAVGIVGAVAMAGVMRSMLFEVSARDPLTIAAIAVVLVAAGLLAGVVPARRATRVDPLIALRET